MTTQTQTSMTDRLPYAVFAILALIGMVGGFLALLSVSGPLMVLCWLATAVNGWMFGENVVKMIYPLDADDADCE